MLNQRQLRILMLQRGIDSQRELARRLRVREWTLTRTIKGRYPNARLIQKIARYFGVDPEWLRKAA